VGGAFRLRVICRFRVLCNNTGVKIADDSLLIDKERGGHAI